MSMYETIYIAQPGLEESDAEALGQSFEQVVVKGQGNLVKSARWGKRKLAYALRKHNEGYFFHLQYDAAPSVLQELERRLRNNEQVLKFLSVRLDRRAVQALAAAEKKAAEKAAARAQREAERAARQGESEDAGRGRTAARDAADDPGASPPEEGMESPSTDGGAEDPSAEAAKE